MRRYVHYGCGGFAPAIWENYDASPTLRVQKTAIIGKVFKDRLNTVFPENVHYGDIIKGLPVTSNSCDGVFCSHVLEHLSLGDFFLALKHTFEMLKPGGIFRCVLPDLEWMVRSYVAELDKENPDASIRFMKNTLLGMEHRPQGLRSRVEYNLGNSHHLWMWDRFSLTKALSDVGFVNIRQAIYNDSEDEVFNVVEDQLRFENALAFQSRRPE